MRYIFVWRIHEANALIVKKTWTVEDPQESVLHFVTTKSENVPKFTGCALPPPFSGETRIVAEESRRESKKAVRSSRPLVDGHGFAGIPLNAASLHAFEEQTYFETDKLTLSLKTKEGIAPKRRSSPFTGANSVPDAQKFRDVYLNVKSADRKARHEKSRP